MIYGRGWARSRWYDRMKAWASINLSILSGLKDPKLSSRLTELYHVQHVMVEHAAQYHVVRPTQGNFF
jgi:hypothetical protein